MGLKIRSNDEALQAYRNLQIANKQTTEAQLRLSSGKRINKVADDTSGFNVGTSLQGKVAVMKGAQGNISAAKNLISTAEGALLNVNDLLTKIEGKLSDAINPTADRTALKDDITAMANEIQSILLNTKFNNTNLLHSAAGKGFAFQVGESGNTLNLDFASALASTGGGGYGANVSVSLGSFANVAAATLESSSGAASVAGLQTALTNLKSAVIGSLGKIGNLTQRLDIKDNNLTVAISNAESSVNRLFNAESIEEQMNATKGSILQQSGMAMLAQLNVAPQQILQMLG